MTTKLSEKVKDHTLDRAYQMCYNTRMKSRNRLDVLELLAALFMMVLVLAAAILA